MRKFLGAFCRIVLLVGCLLHAFAAPAPTASGGERPGKNVVSQTVDPQDKPAVKRLFDAWKTPVPPRRLVGNIYYVGASGVSSFLIATAEGHILLDTGFEDMAPLIHANIEQLGFRSGDIKFLLASHAHVDHTGGHALMRRVTGARVVSSEADARLLESGGAADFSPFPKEFMAYAPVKADRIVNDGEEVSLGGVTLKAHLTPGHTKGATTWTMEVVEEGRRHPVVFFSSVSLVVGTKLLRNPVYPEIVEDYTVTIRKLKTLSGEVFFAPHGGQFAMADKFARLEQGLRPNPFIDPVGWNELIAGVEQNFLKQLEIERAGQR